MMNVERKKRFTQYHFLNKVGIRRVYPTPFSKKSGAGFTVMELLVSSSLFIILIAIASGAFIQTLRTQRTVTNLSASLNDVSFVIEQIAREVRTGSSFSGSASKDTLRFRDPDGIEIGYKHRGSQIGRCEGACSLDSDYDPLTAPDVNLSSATFILQGASSFDGEPPRVTILLSVEGESNIKINLQTTISARRLDT